MRSCFSLIYSLIIDLLLISLGYLIYFHFNIHPLAPLIWNPIVINLFGSNYLATLILAGIPFVVGLLGLTRTGYRIWIGFIPRSVKNF